MSETTDNILVIRKADKTDIHVISTMAHATWPGAYGTILNEAQIKYMLDLFYDEKSLGKQIDEGQVFLIGLMNAETVAFASFSPGNIVGLYKIHKLYVHPMLQKKGIGRKMLERIESEVRNAGGSFLQLNVNRNNSAEVFYKNCGFQIIGEEDIAIGEGYFMNDFIMEKQLPPLP